MLMLAQYFWVFGQAGRNDLSFNADLINFGDGPNRTVQTTTIQSNGKIIIAGQFTDYNGVGRSRIARLNADGSLDTSFDPGMGANSTILTTAIEADGNIIIGGLFTQYNGVEINRIARLNADGSLDTSFNPGTGANSTVFSTAIQADGKIIIGGGFTQYNGVGRNRIARLNGDGSLDTSFNLGSGVGNTVETTAIQANGKIIIGGNFSTYNGVGRNRIARLNPDGSLDTSFDPGTGANSTVFSTAIQEDGKIIIGGGFTQYNGVTKNRITRLNADGGLNTSFNPGTGANSTVFSTAIQVDGKIIIAGQFTEYNGLGRNRIARLNTDGSLDTFFNPGTGASNTVQTTAIQSDGKIIIGGLFTQYDGVAINRIARLNADGSLDTSFDLGTGANGTVLTTAIQADGKIIIGGRFSQYNGEGRNRIARLNPDGSLDTSFNPGTGANWSVRTAIPQPDGKIIIGGDFEEYNGVAIKSIARLNADGSLDTSFNVETSSAVRTTALQPDGRIIIGGDFMDMNSGIVVNWINRLNADGSWDTSFNSRMAQDGRVFTTTLQPDGKIIIGGDFRRYSMVAIKSIARLNADGSLDTSFDPGTGANGTVFTTTLQPDGKIIIGGDFTGYNEVSRVRINRLSNTIGPAPDTQVPEPNLENLPIVEAQCIVNLEDLTIPTATDQKGGTVQGTTDESIFPITTQGSTTITWTYTDADGNTRIQNQEILISDTEVPLILMGENIIADAEEGLCEAMVDVPSARATDNCEVGEPTGLRSDGEPLDAPYPVGVTIITWNLTDVNGNEAEPVEQKVTVVDAELPVIFAEDLTLSANPGHCSAIISLNVFASDNCGVGEPTGTRSDGEALDAPYPVGVTTITWDVSDINGNAAETVIQSITITDDEAPIVIAKNAVIEIQAGNSYTLTIDEVDDGSTDNCGIASRTLDKTLFTEEDEGENIVTLTIEDPAGNENSAQATVIVTVNRDNECVVALAKDIVLILDRNGTASIRVNQVDDGSFTNCSNRIVTRELEKSVFTCADLGEQMVGFWAIDRDGNLGETQFKVTVLDETVPRVANIPNLRVTLGTDEIYVLPDLRLTVNASDNCAVVEYIQIPEPGTIYDAAGTYSIMLRAIDSSGNVGEKTGTLNIRQDTNNRLLDENSNLDGELSDLNWSQEMDEHKEGQLVNQILLDILPNSIKIYPNPASQETNIMVGLSRESNVEIRIFDTAGRLVFIEESQQEGSFTRSIALNGLSNGLYHVVVKIDQQYLQGRLIKK
jgi:uncharacterized delta-60 repeat protein